MLRFIFSLLILTFFLSCNSTESDTSDNEILKERLKKNAIDLGFRPRTDRYIISDFSKAEEYLNSMQTDGSWPDVDYEDHDNNWAPLKHLDRVIVMTVNYADKSSSMYQHKKLLDGLEKSIGYWYQVNPICDNWYKNDIAKQFYFNIIGLLLQGEIAPDLHEKIVNDLTDKPSMTGSNRTLVAISTIYRGVLEKNSDRINEGVKGVTDQVIISDKEGIQPDYSFHQHGHFIYNGSYGHNFLRESIWLATMVHGTDFAYTNEQIQTLRHYYLEGTRWMLRGGLIDYNVRGRQVGRNGGDQLSGYNILPQLDQFIIADPTYIEDYHTSKKLIESHKPQNIIGNKHFWRSDYTVHHRSEFFTSLKMCSERTVGIELNMNSENKLGYWLPYGLTYIYRRGNEYQGIFPAWDWARLPGVTNPYFEYVEKGKGVAYTQETSFVGGVSDGKFGISAMDFSRDSTKSKKAWFWFDEEWVALGAGIQSTHEAHIVTGINQCHLNGKVVVDGEEFEGGSKKLANPKWVAHDSIAYIFPGDEPVKLKAEPQYGNMQRIYGLGVDSIYAPQVFSLWFDHGVKPENANYEYIVVPAKSTPEVEKYAKDLPLTILSNTSKLQAVRHDKSKITGIVFHEAGKLSIDEITVKVDEPSLVLIDHEKGLVSISDPTAKLEKINITIQYSVDQIQEEIVTLLSNEFAGKSVNFKMVR